MLRRLLILTILAATLLAVGGAGHARAGSHQASIMMDDRLLVSGTPAVRDHALDRMKALGVDEVHSLLVWRNTAGGNYGGWDALVGAARARGIKVIFTLTTPAPDSASQCPKATAKRGVCKPSVKKFEAWVKATGKHFGSSVRRWSVMNEPNLDGWLAPKGAFAERRYRDLFRAAVRGLAASGHGKDQILLGETSPVGNRRATAPITFLRGVFCLDSRNRPLKGAAATRLGCKGFTRLRASGIAHHPYTPGAACSPVCAGGPQDVTIASFGRLGRVLDAAAKRGRITKAAAHRIYVTEFGFQSNPPNKGGVISLSEQERYLNWSEAIAFHSPRVKAWANYELDDAGVQVFNTGLAFISGTPKPSYAAWRVPIFVTKAKGGYVRVFGGVRPGGGHTVKVQVAKAGKAFRTAKTVHTNSAGYLYVRVKATGSRWRLSSSAGKSRTARAQ